MIHDDIIFLKQAFQSAMKIVGQDELCVSVLKRKFAHSWRVLQNGRAIIDADIPELTGQPDLKRQCEQALLLHDVGRFEETVTAYKDKAMQNWGKKYDHGVLGALILAENPTYNDKKTVLAVRHHGHMIEDFYNDEEYQNLPADEQTKAELMVKLVRDADKLDLYYLQREEDNIESDPFFCNLPEELKYAPISPKVWEQFEAKQTICHKTIRSLSDRILGCISWQFDFNYPLTGKIYRSEGYHDMLVRLLDKYCPDKNIIKILK